MPGRERRFPERRRRGGRATGVNHSPAAVDLHPHERVCGGGFIGAVFRAAAIEPGAHSPAFAVGADSGDSGIMAEPAASLPDTETLPGRVKRSLITRAKPSLIGRVLYPKN